MKSSPLFVMSASKMFQKYIFHYKSPRKYLFIPVFKWRRTGNVCNVDMDCPDNAFCKLNSYCVCKDGFVYAAVNSTHKGCLKEARIGEECVQHIQCHSTMGVHSECANNVCACTPTAHLEDDRCYETAGEYRV
ncbi:hypothetical protein O3G_MSEX015312 [Manduca sexta]|uniref:EB domain-containing protein n=1 Tax=Manduca sexta TaxID=7130 RepID=A0A922CZP7_MANSE|nr:hypothetical protein O3G_MSEX015312 [Manduca sexta]